MYADQDESQEKPSGEEAPFEGLEDVPTQPLRSYDKPPKADSQIPKGPEPESKASVFFKRALRWAVAVAGLFTLGVLTAFFLLYLPAARKSRRLQDQIDTQAWLFFVVALVNDAGWALRDAPRGGARLHLKDTEDTLESLADILEGDEAEIVDLMLTRLDDALDNMEEDPAGALADLNVLMTNLILLLEGR